MQIALPDYATRFDSLSLSACFLDLKGVGDTPRQASGFFWRHRHKVYLITNWHVVTGTNMMDGRSMARGWSPERLIVEYFAKDAAGANASVFGADGQGLTGVKFDFPLHHEFHSPLWLQHKMAFEWSVDIVALELGDEMLGNKASIFCVNDFQYPKLYHFAGSDVFVLGHPLPRAVNNYPVQFPVWKRGSIASELIVPWNMRPAFLIDCRTSKGMSGSPAFAKVFGPAAYGDGTIHTDAIMTTEFMGVYSGRLFDDDNNASIGLVWHRNLIDQLLDDPAPGTREWVASRSVRVFEEFVSAAAR